ncbi:uncharacterized protein LOC119333370 [Triticum dicoccoides]|uniref:uncharacterized protein LOC119333370 n=1 Tax=Triticum dicoccoides TaxID=85692 RepID=UPI001891D678|nr:uncharacterized protein LOC119333370 [Triticum dicoccoides]XP_044422196.1 uncharacterized protein LOC123147007 isoform X2 [Triticum aestivum]
MALMKTNARTIVCFAALAVMATHLMSSADALDCYPINDCRSNSNGGVKCARMCALLNGPSGKAYCSGTTQRLFGPRMLLPPLPPPQTKLLHDDDRVIVVLSLFLLN